MNYNFEFNLTTTEIIIAALLAFAVTTVIKYIYNLVKAAHGGHLEFGFQMKDAAMVLQRCCRMFPMDIIHFREKTFSRGMKVRVTTDKQKVFEGQIIGLNNDGMLCVIVKNSIVAHQIDKIEKIENMVLNSETKYNIKI